MVWQKAIQHHKAINLQLKANKILKNDKRDIKKDPCVYQYTYGFS